MKKFLNRGLALRGGLIPWPEVRILKKITSAMLTAVAFGLVAGTVSAVQLPVGLGTAGNYVILSKSGIATTGTTSIAGNIGVSPISSIGITGFGLTMDATNQFSTSSLVNGNVYAPDYAPPTPSDLTTAVADMETAFTDAAGRTLPDFTELGAGNIGGMTLAPGLYKWGTGVLIPAGGVTLSGTGNDVWIFQIAQDLTVNSGAIVTLSGGAQAKNIFWQVAGKTTLGTTSDVKGIILSKTLISLNTGAVLHGRALAQTAVTLIANSVIAPASGATSTTKRDFNGDGKADLLWQHTNGTVSMWLMDGVSRIASATLAGAGSGWSIKQVGDFNGDGKADLLWQHTDGTVSMWLMNGTVMSSSATLIGANGGGRVGGGWSVNLVADFNGDGKADLLWQHTDGTVSMWLMDGVSRIASVSLAAAGSGWSAKQVGDFNGDGKADLLWQHTDGSIAMWLMNGAAMSSSATLIGASGGGRIGGGWSVKQVADFNGDGKDDLLWQLSDGTVAMWLMDGISRIAFATLAGAGSGWNVNQVGDFNGDGKADLLWQHTDGSIAMWLVNGTAMSSGASITGPGPGAWSVKQVADYNGNSKADLLWQRIDGSVAMWLMNGTTHGEAAFLMGARSGWSPSP